MATAAEKQANALARKENRLQAVRSNITSLSHKIRLNPSDSRQPRWNAKLDELKHHEAVLQLEVQVGEVMAGTRKPGDIVVAPPSASVGASGSEVGE